VRAESAGVDRGAAFTVRLPADTAAAGAMDERARAGIAGDRRRLAQIQVLVVDDDGPTRDVVSTILTSAGATVTAVGSAAEARSALARTRPSVVVADIAMPVEDGFSLMRSLRAGGSGADMIPAIALTALTRSTDIDAALAAGFQAHVPKPVNVGQLVSAVAALAAKRAA
jgi:CheY-like chemotaxis protein